MSVGSLDDAYEKGKVWIDLAPFYQPLNKHASTLSESLLHRLSVRTGRSQAAEVDHPNGSMVFEPISGLLFR